MRVSQQTLNVIGLATVAVAIAVSGYDVGVKRTEYRLQPYLSRGSGELQTLAARYGSARNSRYGEEWMIRDFFEDRRGGIFVDVGANHYQRESNTFYLETQLGWSGLAIEPQIKFAADYRTHRPLTTFVPLFVSDVSDRQATLYVPSNDLIASFDKDFAEAESGSSANPVSTQTTTLDDILDRHGIREVDFLSMDIELHEPQALKGFSIERFQPGLVVVESHAPVRQQILDYFASHRYVVIGKYLRGDSENLWFTPIGQAGRESFHDVAGSH
jgi:FkbM family methyltransferase